MPLVTKKTTTVTRPPLAAPPMIVLTPQDDPRLAGWFEVGVNCTELGYDLVTRGALDDGIWEVPWGSNKGGRINRYHDRTGYDHGQAWCAIWLSCVYADRGCFIPKYSGAVDWWLPYSEPMSLERLKQIVRDGGEGQRRLAGAAIIYGKRGNIPFRLANGQPAHPDVLKSAGWDGVHIGMITRAEVNSGANAGVGILTREGNRGLGIVTNNGVICDQDITERHDIIAIHYPTRAPNYVPRRQIIREVAE